MSSSSSNSSDCSDYLDTGRTVQDKISLSHLAISCKYHDYDDFLKYSGVDSSGVSCKPLYRNLFIGLSQKRCSFPILESIIRLDFDPSDNINPVLEKATYLTKLAKFGTLDFVAVCFKFLDNHRPFFQQCIIHKRYDLLAVLDWAIHENGLTTCKLARNGHITQKWFETAILPSMINLYIVKLLHKQINFEYIFSDNLYEETPEMVEIARIVFPDGGVKVDDMFPSLRWYTDNA